MTKLRMAAIVATLILLPCGTTAAAETFLTFESQPGDYIGGGINRTWTPADGTFAVRGTFRGGVEVSFRTPDFGTWWYLDFGPPDAQTLTNKEYEGAQRFAIDFEQHCEGGPAALFGSVRFNSDVPAVPRVSVADAGTLKGNVGTNDGTL